MIIINNKIKIWNVELYIGMPYEQAESILGTRVYLKRSPDEKGLGHIILEDIDFYDLKGSCTLYFQDSRLEIIGIEPQWNKYDLTDKNGDRLRIDSAVEKVASMSKNGLKKAFGEPDEQSNYGNMVFYHYIEEDSYLFR
mgnify:CR=1 FL=1|jgi:hypothetical protein